MNHEPIGLTIRSIRERSALSMSDVAKALGVSVVFVSDFERGRRNVPLGDKFETILDTLGVPEAERGELRELNLRGRGSVTLPLTGDDARDGLAIRLGLCWDRLDERACRGIVEALAVLSAPRSF